ncbi:hypothetical protein NLM16_34830 [Bradyrhizobium brasilense]|uniref:Integrase n=1 Tax=Bradyrhizobium brasilense TaxID=1419277 RepID=A0ABY8JA19_9BRAD|nr:hypothetical protein [Bradyrhizobium brasilense]MCP3419295.1 hypothetical protein [Bradyrhizobium brasilense]WFU62407.1 hypothetical protein QA636_33665 [Bradyrhizobium brasilense]
MYDVYLNERNDLLVVPRGNSIPIDLNRNWRKKRIVRSVSEQIREDVRLYGYHRRKLPLSRSMKTLAEKQA